MNEGAEPTATDARCWGAILGALHQRIARIQSEILALHMDAGFLNSNAARYREMQEELRQVEDYLFRAKDLLAYLRRLERDGAAVVGAVVGLVSDP